MDTTVKKIPVMEGVHQTVHVRMKYVYAMLVSSEMESSVLKIFAARNA